MSSVKAFIKNKWWFYFHTIHATKRKTINSANRSERDPYYKALLQKKSVKISCWKKKCFGFLKVFNMELVKTRRNRKMLRNILPQICAGEGDSSDEEENIPLILIRHKFRHQRFKHTNELRDLLQIIPEVTHFAGDINIWNAIADTILQMSDE